MIKKITLFLIIIFVVIGGLYVFLINSAERAVRETANVYLEAVRDREFEIVYKFNASSQKQMLFIFKGSDANKEEILKLAYHEQKRLFDSVQQTFDPHAIWSEKAALIPDMNYKVAEIVMQRDIENPTAFYRKRINATVEVEVEYIKQGTAPIFEGRGIKKAIYRIKMVHTKNIAKAVKLTPLEDKWLFKGIAIKEGSLVYWQ